MTAIAAPMNTVALLLICPVLRFGSCRRCCGFVSAKTEPVCGFHLGLISIWRPIAVTVKCSGLLLPELESRDIAFVHIGIFDDSMEF